MYAIMGITGHVGGATARELLNHGQKVRGIVRDKTKAMSWQAAGVKLAVADWTDPSALEVAFRGVEGVFVMIPPNFAPTPGYPETRQIVAGLRQALAAARPPKAVCLSSVGAQHPTGLGLITQLHILEQELSSLPIPTAFIRAAWFLENFQWEVASARDHGEIASLLHPLDKEFPMVATRDIGRLSAEVLQQQWIGNRRLELEGPERYSQWDAAESFSRLLNRSVLAKSVARDAWQSYFENQGMPANRTASRIEMLDGFNSGWIDFEQKGTEHFRGSCTQEKLFQTLIH